MNDRAALTRAVLAAPADDLPRMVLADWLDENGETERAGYVRASVRLAALVAADELDSDDYAAAVGVVGAVPFGSLWEWACADGLPLYPHPGAVTRSMIGALDWVRDVAADEAVGFRRGFPEAVRCRAVHWADDFYQAVAVAPLGRVELTDREPYRHRVGEWVWVRWPGETFGGPAGHLPDPIFDELPEAQSTIAVYPSRAVAVNAASAACLGYARKRLGIAAV